MNITLNYYVNDILRPFHGLLEALIARQPAQERAAAVQSGQERTTPVQALVKSNEPSASMQSMRRKTSREFHIWDRVKETIESHDSISAKVQKLSGAQLVTPAINIEPEPLLDAAQLAKTRAAFTRARTTHTRLKSLEVYLSKSESQKSH